MVKCEFECSGCDYAEVLLIDIEAYQRWNARELLVQDAFPHLSPQQRELIMSATCDKCWRDMFAYDEEWDNVNTDELEEQ